MVATFAPTMSLTNLLATPADVRLSCPSSLQLARRGGGSGQLARGETALGTGNGNGGRETCGGVWSDTIQRGTEVSWFHCPPDEEVMGWAVVLLQFLSVGVEW